MLNCPVTTKQMNPLVMFSSLLIYWPVECFGSSVFVAVVGEYHAHDDTADDQSDLSVSLCDPREPSTHDDNSDDGVDLDPLLPGLLSR